MLACRERHPITSSGLAGATMSLVPLLACLAILAPMGPAHAGPEIDTLSECFVLAHLGNAFLGKSVELRARDPAGGWRTIGTMADVGFQMSALGFPNALEHLDRKGTEAQFAVSRDGRVIVFRTASAAGKGAGRIEPGIHRYVCGAGDTFLYPESACSGASYGAPEGLPRDVMLFGLRDSILDPHDAVLALRADGAVVPLVLLDAPALHAAAYDGRTAAVDSLVRLGADPLARNLLKMSAVDVALWCGHEDAAIHLIEATPKDTTTLQELLSVATLFGRTRVLEVLLDRGADPNRPIAGSAGRGTAVTPLRVALENPPRPRWYFWAGRGNGPDREGQGRVESQRFLLDGGADPNGLDARGRTPLHALARSSDPVATTLVAANLDAARRLIEHGADVMRQSAEGNTPLHTLVGTHSDITYSQSDFRARWGRDPYGQMLELFVSHTKDLEVRNARGMTALQRAVEARNFLAAHYLVAHGASDQVEYRGHPVREILATEFKSRRGSGFAKFREETFPRRYEGAPRSAHQSVMGLRMGPE